MLKILCLVDKKGTALDRLAQGVAKYHKNLEYVVLDVHPKRPDPEQLARFEKEIVDTDIIDAQYYRTLYKLRELYPQIKQIKTILTHNNPYSVEEQAWNDVELNVGNNEYITKRLGEITEKPVEYIPLCVDTDLWTFNQDWQPNHNVIMVANRIESKKGILPVAIACNELNLHFILVGAISDMNYFQAIEASGNLEFHQQIEDDKLLQLYHNSTIHVSNSKDNFESGTLPLLEAMLSGVPVLTRNTGHVPELNNGENMVIQDKEVDDVEHIKAKLLEMISDKKRLAELRDRAWQTAKTRSHERRAYLYQRLYRQVINDETPVSIIVPAYDKPEITRKCLDAISNQNHKNIEVLLVDDSNTSDNINIVYEIKDYISYPLRYINTYNNDYGLARARNEGIIEATGEIIVFVDQRMIIEPDTITEFLKYLKPKTWLYGNKGGNKTEFVENISCIYREDVINFGLFNERMIWYGGLSQETRTRFRNQGGRTEYIESAKCTPSGKSSNKNRKKQDIIKAKNRLFKLGL